MTTAINRLVYGLVSGAVDPIPVRDLAREGQALPWVQLGRVVEANADRLTALKSRYLVYLSIWSDYPGQAEVLRIIETIKTAVHRHSGPLFDDDGIQSGRAVIVLVRSTSTDPEPDGKTYMGSITLDILAER